MKKIILLLFILNVTACFSQTNKTVLGTFAAGCKVFNYEFVKSPNGLCSFKIENLDKEEVQTVFNKDSVLSFKNNLDSIIIKYDSLYVLLKFPDSLKEAKRIAISELIKRYQKISDRIIEEVENLAFWKEQEDSIKTVLKESETLGLNRYDSALITYHLKPALKNINKQLEIKANKTNNSTLYTFNDFTKETFTPVCTDLIKRRKNIFLQECQETDLSIDNIAEAVFYQIKTKLEFTDDEPLTAYLKLKNKQINCYYTKKFKLRTSSLENDQNNYLISNKFLIENVGVEFEDGTIKNIFADLIPLDSNGKPLLCSNVRFKNTKPISISSRNDKDNFSDENIFISDFGVINHNIMFQKKHKTIYDTIIENDSVVYTKQRQEITEKKVKLINKKNEGEEKNIALINVYKNFMNVQELVKETAKADIKKYRRGTNNHDKASSDSVQIAKKNKYPVRKARERIKKAKGLIEEAKREIRILQKAEKVKYSIYFVLSDLIDYVDILESNKEDYSPANGVVNLSEKYPVQELRKEKRSRIITVKTFTDFMGIKDDQPNGLIQIEASRKFNLLTKRLGRKGLYYGGLTYLEPKLIFSKIEKNNNLLSFTASDLDTNEYQNNDKKVFYTDAVNLLKYQSSAFDIDLNLCKVNFPIIKSNFQLNASTGIFRTNVCDTIVVSNHAYNMSNTPNNKILNTIRWGASLVYELKPENRFGFDCGYDFRFYQLLSKDYILNLDKGKNLVHSFFVNMYLKTNAENMLFFRYRVSFVGPANEHNFSQIQLGYLINIFKTSTK